MKRFSALGLASTAFAMHEFPHPQKTEVATGECISPGQCVPPRSKYSRVVPGPAPGQQWNIDGGFCGSWSTQQTALAHGAWISQDLVRKANRDQTGIAFNMHGNTKLGYEVVPSNVLYTVQGLKLKGEQWDYMSPKPQAAAYKAWLKSHLVQGHPVVWFPMCKGDGPTCPYEGACPNGGVISHVEPMFGVFSNHSLHDPTVYDDDWVLHASDQDEQPYYRPLSTMEDSPAMDGNCDTAQPGFGKNEMYPCFDELVTYGVAITGLAVEGSLPVSLTVDSYQEPNVRSFQKPSQLHATATVHGLKAGQAYSLYRFNSTELLPAAQPFASNAMAITDFTAAADTYRWSDPVAFASDSAVYYLAAPKAAASSGPQPMVA